MLLRYAGLLWTLPTPHTILTVGLAWELSHLISNCDESRSSFQVLKSGLGANVVEVKMKIRSLFT